ncbi:MAG: hypothetical protein RMK18_02295 [Armatimonadota bacterium]|nr:hypothetical protein [Armatimonadota bacterium]MCX7777274.1 hypothetical protein [Armatimonadota bacterium]MDW8024688.1 hypothetical protein [Armatimonadota bacterium]
MDAKSAVHILGSLSLYVILKAAIPMLPIKPSAAVIYISMFLLTATAFMLARMIATMRRCWRTDIIAMAMCLLVWMAGFWLGEISAGKRYGELATITQEVGLLCFASFSGKTVSLVIREGNLLLPAAMAMMLVDVWFVNLSGATPQVANRAGKLFKAMTVKLPPAGAKKIPAPALLMGFGDIFFAALIIAALHRFGFEVRVSFWLAVLAASLGLTLVSLLDIPLAGLPFIAGGLLLPNIHRLKLTREEWIATGIGIGMLAVILIAAWLALNR